VGRRAPVDGRGCFRIVPIFQTTRYRLGWQVQPDFSVVRGQSVRVHRTSWSGGHFRLTAMSVAAWTKGTITRRDLYRYNVGSLRHILSLASFRFFEGKPTENVRQPTSSSFALSFT